MLIRASSGLDFRLWNSGIAVATGRVK